LAKVEMIRMTPDRILCKDSSGNNTFDTNDLFLRQFSGGELVVGGTNIGTPLFYGLGSVGPFNIGGGYMSETFGGSSYASGFSDWNYDYLGGIHPYLIKGYETYVPAGEVKLISWFDVNQQGDSLPTYSIGGYTFINYGGNSWFRVGAYSKTNPESQSKIPRPPGQQQWVSSTQYVKAYGVPTTISYRWRFWYDPSVFLNGYYVRLEVINPTCTLSGYARLSIDDFDVQSIGVPGYSTLPYMSGWFGKFNLSYLVSKPPINLTAEVTV
jgi:hypothetical protein